MRTSTILVLLLLCLSFFNTSAAQRLSRAVTVEYKNQTIRYVLNDISKKQKVNFSYSNNVVPLERKVTVSAKSKPLSEVLTQVLKDTDIEFEEVGSQIVLKKAPHKPSKAETTAPARQTTSVDPLETRDVRLQASNSMLTEPDYSTILERDNLSREELRRQYLEERSKLRHNYYTRLDSLEKTSDTDAVEELKVQFRRIMDSLQRQVSRLNDSVETEKVRREYKSRSERNAAAQRDSSGYFYSPVAATFVPTIGTNGLLAGQTVNGVSFNFVGRAAGLDGVEFGYILNSEKDFMYGAQFSGVINHVEGTVRGGQFAGLLNTSGGTLNGVQASGFANIASAEAKAVQAAGFINIARKGISGAQAAGFMNISDGNTEGAQVAGFMNVAADTIQGSQVAGFMNVAKVVKGSQIGVFNFADSVSGVQLGFLSFSRKGYRRLELSGNETFHGNITFKTGTSKLYNIFSVGGRTENSVATWGFGYGLGSEFKLSRRLTFNLDLLAHQVHRDGFQGKELNLLGQLKPTFGVLLGKKTSLFVGPTLNVFVSDDHRYRPLNVMTEADDPATLAPSWYTFSNTHKGVNVTGWFGFNGGIRF